MKKCFKCGVQHNNRERWCSDCEELVKLEVAEAIATEQENWDNEIFKRRPHLK